MLKTVRMYGVLPHIDAVRAQLASLAGCDIEIVRGDPKDDQLAPEVWQSDLLLFGFCGPDQDQLTDFLGRVIATFGAWSYLPQVVVGEEANVDARPDLLRLGASCYVTVKQLPDDDPDEFAKKIANKAYTTWRATWWQTECQRDIPVVVVNRKGIIERANPCAVSRFGPEPLVNRPYMTAVERGAGGELPADHPISLSFPKSQDPHERRWGRTVSAEHQFRGRDGQEERFLLTSTPMIVPGALRSVALALFDMSRWSRILEASDSFARAKDRNDFLNQVVGQAARLGFTRVRLYELVPGEQRLYGRAARGFRDRKKHEHFVSKFSIPGDDGTTVITLKDRRYACLYIHGEGTATKYTEYRPRRTEHVEELEWEGVDRWVEAPIFLPPAGDEQEPVAWGKLSLDLGTKSDQLTVRDVGDVAVFCSIIGHALALMARVEFEEQQRRREEREGERLRVLTEGLVAAIKPDEPYLMTYVSRCLRLILEVTGAEAVLYRRYDRQHPALLRLIGDPEFQDAAVRDRFKSRIPPSISRDRGLRRYFRHFSEGERHTKGVYAIERSSPELEQFARESEDQYRPWLDFIKSELHVPVFRGQDIVGVIMVSSGRPNAFPQAMVAEVEGLVHAVSLGIESARRHDHWLLMGEGVRRVLGYLPKLAAIPTDNDDAFFAGLATLLSASQGLRWNRVFVFSCHVSKPLPNPPNTAELVYALGGLANAPAPDERRQDPRGHCALQERFRNDGRYQDLGKLLDERIANPEPHWRSPDGEETVEDELYNLCVANPREAEQPIRVDEDDPPLGPSPHPGDPPVVEETCPVCTLLRWGRLRDDLPRECDPFTIEVAVAKDGERYPNRWVMNMAGEHRGMFNPSEHRLFGFLLRGAADPDQGPLGVVLVDMQAPHEVDEQDMVAATRLFLRLAADVLAERDRRRRYNGIINSLPARCHGPALWNEWEEIYEEMKAVIDPLQSEALSKLKPPKLFDALARSLFPLLETKLIENPGWATILAGKVAKFNERMTRLDGNSKPRDIPDLGAVLREWKRHYFEKKLNELVVLIHWEPEVEGLRVPCDPLVLQDAIGAMIDNSRAEAVRCRRELSRPGLKLNVRLHAKVVNTGCKAIPQIVELEYSDDGGGIAPEHRRRVLIDGFTLSESSPAPDKFPKGRGLALIKRQLLEYRGCLECADPGGAGGARFIIQLGLPATDRTNGADPAQLQGREPMPRVLIVYDKENDDDTRPARCYRAAVDANFPPEEIVFPQSWADAVGALRSGPFTAAVIDIELWGRSEGGVDYIRELHTLDPKCRIIAITGRRGSDAGVRAQRAGAEAFINIMWDVEWTKTLTEKLTRYRANEPSPATTSAE
jgi:signal transduction histidine kinase/ActR/RegA family two-component response regulator